MFIVHEQLGGWYWPFIMIRFCGVESSVSQQKWKTIKCQLSDDLLRDFHGFLSNNMKVLQNDIWVEVLVRVGPNAVVVAWFDF